MRGIIGDSSRVQLISTIEVDPVGAYSRPARFWPADLQRGDAVGLNVLLSLVMSERNVVVGDFSRDGLLAFWECVEA